MERAKFPVVINWVGQQTFDIEASSRDEAELKAAKMVAYESVRVKPQISVQQLTAFQHIDGRVVAVVAATQ